MYTYVVQPPFHTSVGPTFVRKSAMISEFKTIKAFMLSSPYIFRGIQYTE